MKRLACCVGILLVAGVQGAAPDRAEITVRVVPQKSTLERGQLHRRHLDPTRPFRVVLTNVSPGPLRLWEAWNSWGYANLSFEVIDERGKSHVLRRKPGEFDKNYPSWFYLPSGDPMILDVDWKDNSWEWVPDRPEPRGFPEIRRMRAIYSVTPDRDSEEQGVWTGSVSSPVESYLISQ